MKFPKTEVIVIPTLAELLRIHELELRRDITERQGNEILELLMSGFAGATIEVMS